MKLQLRFTMRATFKGAIARRAGNVLGVPSGGPLLLPLLPLGGCFTAIFLTLVRTGGGGGLDPEIWGILTAFQLSEELLS